MNKINEHEVKLTESFLANSKSNILESLSPLKDPVPENTSTSNLEPIKTATNPSKESLEVPNRPPSISPSTRSCEAGLVIRKQKRKGNKDAISEVYIVQY